MSPLISKDLSSIVIPVRQLPHHVLSNIRQRSASGMSPHLYNMGKNDYFDTCV